MSIFDKKKKPIIPKKKVKSQQELTVDALLLLENARKKNLGVIDSELRNINYGRKSGILSEQAAKNEERSVMKVKKAYYAIGLIDDLKLKIVDMQTTEELFSAMNDINKAMSVINNMHGKGEKPNTRQFGKGMEKIERMQERDAALLEDMYVPADDIDSLVSNDVVEHMINGGRIEDCLRQAEGFMMGFDNFRNSFANIPGTMGSGGDETVQPLTFDPSV